MSRICTVFILFVLILLTSCSRYSDDKQSKLIMSDIYGGENVHSHQDKWNSVVQLKIRYSSFCTGVFIDYSTIVTAAHCVKGIVKDDDQNYSKYVSSVRVVIGSGAIEDTNISLKIVKARVHPEYNKAGNDFAYLKLEKPISSDLVKIIPPMSNDESDKYLKEGAEIIAVGFGRTEDKTTGLKKFLKTRIRNVSSDVVSGIEMFEIGDGKNGVCSGDSGGPTFIRVKDGQLRVASIASMVRGKCGVEGYHSVVGNIIFGMNLIKSDQLISEADSLLSSGEEDKALMLYEEAGDLYINIQATSKMLSIYESREDDENISKFRNELFLQKGYHFFILSDYEKALDFFKESNAPLAFYFQAIIYMRSEKFEEAINSIDQYIIDGKDQDDFLFFSYQLRARVLHLNGDFKKAQNQLEYYIANNTEDDFEVNKFHARILWDLEFFEQAKDELKKYLESFPNDNEANAMLYEMFEIQKNETESLFYKNKMIEIATNDMESVLAATKSFGKFKAMLEVAEKFIKLDSDNAIPYFYIGVNYFRKEKYEKALEYADLALERDIHYVDGFNLKGATYLSMKRYDEAIEYCKKAIKIEPAHEFATINLMHAYLGKGEFENAITVLSQKIEIAPTVIDYHLRAQLYSSNDDFQNAIADFEQIVDRDASNHYRYFFLADLYYKTGLYEKSINMAKKLIIFRPDFFPAFFLFIQCHVQLENHQIVIDKISILIKQMPEKNIPVEFYQMRGNAYLAMGHSQEAEFDLMRFKELNKEK